jgi:mannose-1-phosphate guanylyltransferase/mannose-6-phosphate isomerase
MSKVEMNNQTPLLIPVVLAGGDGSRLWPLSRPDLPKQFLKISDEGTLFQSACRRLHSLSDGTSSPSPILIVANEKYRFQASKQLGALGIDGDFLSEPVGRNTAPALTIAAFQASKTNDPILFVTPADHAICSHQDFVDAAHEAIAEASKGGVVVFGVKPDSPHTGYGYIKSDGLTKKVQKFVEKPNLAKAEQYLEEGCYFWNAGIFVLRASVWLKSLKTFRPDIFSATKRVWDNRSEIENVTHFNEGLFSQIPADSVDYAVLEKLSGSDIPVKMIELNAGWNDVGSWEQLAKTMEADVQGNRVDGDVIICNTTNSYVNASSRLVAVVGLDSVVVVETSDALLVLDKKQSQDVSKVVRSLKNNERKEVKTSRKVHKPWGWYDSLDRGERFQVKRIHVYPDESLSLQKHFKRSEHWVVVKGIAEVTCGSRTQVMTENMSIDIPLGEIHRLANPGNEPLEIIEVQFGEYLEEDDIERIEDKYSRLT